MPPDMPDTSNKAIGRRLVAVRSALGWTQAYTASLIGESYQRWGHYERGDRVPKPAMLARFWQLTGATSDYILFGHMHGLPLHLTEALATNQGEPESGAESA